MRRWLWSSVVLALGVLWTYAGLDLLPIYGTIGILLVAYVAHFLPLGTRAMAAALRQVHPELEDAARVSGASLLRLSPAEDHQRARPEGAGGA